MNIKTQNPLMGYSLLSGGGLMKSTAQKLERQARRDSQVDFFENQKKNLKNIQCSSPEEVARVLELLHSYEDQIAAAKAEYNNAQMFHLMDEAKEQGERNARAIEKSEPKTAEERKKAAVEEALGIDEEKGLLSDILDKVTEEAAKALEDLPEGEASLDSEPVQATETAETTELPEPGYGQPQEVLAEHPGVYKRFDAFA